MGTRVKVESVIRACLHARLAANTAAAVEIDYAVLTTKERAGWTDRDAWCVIAVIAAHHAKMAAGMRKGTFFNVFDPGAKDTQRDAVLFLARQSTRVASDTSVMIDDKAVTQFRSPKMSFLPALITPMLIAPADRRGNERHHNSGRRLADL